MLVGELWPHLWRMVTLWGPSHHLLHVVSRRGEAQALGTLLRLLVLVRHVLVAEVRHIRRIGTWDQAHKVTLRILTSQLLLLLLLLHACSMGDRLGLLLLLYLQVGSSEAHLLHWEVEITSLDLRIMIGDELLDDLVASILEFIESLRHGLLNFL